MSFFNHLITNKKIDSTEILIFDSTNSHLIVQLIKDDYSYDILETRPFKFVLSIDILIRFLFNLKDLKIFNKYSHKHNFLKNFFWQILCIYIKSYIQKINPKALITSIDNCTKFGWISKNLKDIPCVAIQNGFRLDYDVEQSIYNCQHLFCFGEFEKENFRERGYQVDNFYPIGSVFASLKFEKYDFEVIKNKYDILVVSCWRGNIGFGDDVKDSMFAMSLFDKDFAEYLTKKSLKAAVILRSERDSDQWFMPEIGMNEENYYKSIYGDNIEIIDTNFSERNIYAVMAQSELIIAGFSSTALLEAYGIGKKILYCNYTNTNKYHIDFNENIVFKKKLNEESHSLHNKLDSLLDTSKTDYINDHKHLMKYYHSYDFENDTQKSIISRLNKIISIR